MTQHIGILTSGGDSPGLNAAIRGVGKACMGHYGMEVIGFRDGFRGLMENRTVASMAASFRESSPWAAPCSAPAVTNPHA
jgi:6-phosphofructokinase